MNSIMFKRNDEILTSKVGNEIVMMSIKESKYFGLNKTGSMIWNILESPMTLQDICQRMSNDFKISYKKCLDETQPFIDEMLKEKVITIHNI